MVKRWGGLEGLPMTRLSLIVSVACIAFGVLFYLGSIGGLLWAEKTPPFDHGVLPTAVVFVLFGALGLLLGRGRPAEVR